MNSERIPRISVITPCYRHAEFLDKTIDSVLSQGYPRLEYIIIDGGSDDGSVEIIRKYAPHLAYWCSEPDRGQYDAINKGMARATGDVLCWLNSDDMYFPWTLRTVGSIFGQLPTVEWLTTLQPGFWDREGYCLGFENVAGISRQSFIEGCHAEGTGRYISYIQQESTFWRRDLWMRAGGALRTHFGLAADFDLWARFCLTTEPYGAASPLAGFRFTARQRSQQVEQYRTEALASLAECRLTWARLNGLEADMAASERPFIGRRITRKDRDGDAGHWAIEEYTFS